MAITGTFAADFSNFTTAVDAADVKLKGFEDDSKKVETSLTRMGNALSGTKMIQDATLMAKAVEDLGGVSKLTETELQRLGAQANEAIAKMQATGITQIPANLQNVANAANEAKKSTSGWADAIGMASGALQTLGISVSVGAVVAMGKAVMADADALETLADKTGITTTNLQLMQIAGDDAGVSLESMTGAVTMLQKRLGSGDEGAAAALRDLGIELSQFKNLNAAQQMDEVSRAIQGIHDPLRVADDLSKLFGKSWAELLPVLKRGFTEVHEGATVMGETTTKALDAAGDAMGRFYRAAKANLGEAMADILTNSTKAFRDLQDSMNAAFDQAVKNQPNFAKAMGAIVPPGLPADLEKIVAESNAWAAAQKVVAEGMAELQGLGKGFQETINGIDGTIVEAVKWYLEAGASQSALAKAFDLTAAQVGAIDRSMKAYTATLKAVMDVERQRVDAAETGLLGLSKAEQEQTQRALTDQAKAADAIQKLYDQQRDARMKASLDAASYEIAKIYEVADANVAAMQKTGATSQQIAEYTKQVYAAADLAASQVEYKADSVLTNVTAKAQAAISAIDRAIQQVESNMPVDLTGNAAAAAAQAGGGGGAVMGAGGVTYVTGSGVGSGTYKPLSQLPNYSQSQMPVIGGARATGGPVTGGTPYLVGERGPELYVPTTSGTIVPNNVITQFKNTFHLTDTQDGLARKIAAVLMRSLTSAQQLPLH